MPPTPTWTADRITKAAQLHQRRTGCVPSTTDWKYATADHPCAGVVRLRFGPWNEMLKAAGLKSQHRSKRIWSKPEMLQAACEQFHVTGKSPTATSWRTASDTNPSCCTVRNHFGSWESFLTEAGLDCAPPTKACVWCRESILDVARQHQQAHGTAPTRWQWTGTAPGRPEASTVYNYFDSWPAMLEEAGLQPTTFACLWDRENVIEAFVDWAEGHGSWPSPKDWQRRGIHHPHRDTVYKLPMLWDEAIEAAQELAGRSYPRAAAKPRAKSVKRNPEQILACVGKWKRETGAWPRLQDWEQSDDAWPTGRQVRKHFGSWANLMEPFDPRMPTGKHTRKYIPPRIRHQVMIRDNNTCQNPRCTRQCIKMTVDHILAHKKGGSNELENLQVLCHSCNSSKHVHSWEYFLQWQEYLATTTRSGKRPKMRVVCAA